MGPGVVTCGVAVSYPPNPEDIGTPVVDRADTTSAALNISTTT
jgi:hypothetical protein